MGAPHLDCAAGECERCDALWLLDNEVTDRGERLYLESVVRTFDAPAVLARLEGEEGETPGGSP